MNSSESSQKIRIAWFTPSKSANESLSEVFSAELLPILSETLEIKVFTDSFEPYENYSSAHYLTAVQAHQQNPFDLFIYQVENHTRSHFSRAHLGLIPGLVIFHHLNFVDYGAESFLNSPWTKVLPELMQTDINWPSRSNKYLPVGPFGNREAGYALQALFTNPQNLSEFKRSVIKDSISSQFNLEPKHLAFPVAIPKDIQFVTTFELASTAKPTIAERMPQLLKALQASPAWKLNWLIEFTEKKLAEALINEFQVESQVILTFGRTVKNWEKTLARSSVASHLLFSVYEQPCPYLGISMASSKVIIASDYGFLDTFPENLVYKIAPGVGETETLIVLLKEFVSNSELLLFKESYSYAEEHFSKELIATELSNLIYSNLSQYQNFYANWQEFSGHAKQALITDVASLMNQQMIGFSAKFSWDNTLKLQFQELGWI